MIDRNGPGRDIVAARYEFADDYDQSLEEAEAELRDAGVDVKAFLDRIHARIEKQKDEERLAWRAAAS